MIILRVTYNLFNLGIFLIFGTSFCFLQKLFKKILVNEFNKIYSQLCILQLCPSNIEIFFKFDKVYIVKIDFWELQVKKYSSA